ncbi:MAG TPA: beta-ketoacyl reductase, partial [Euzebya sp.]|nr:beta-ketoacyl reductase [Euzebya sp.]
DPGDPGDHGGPAQPPILAEGTEPQTWLVLGEGADAVDGGAHSDAVARGLALAGARVILAHAADGATLERSDDGTYLVDPADPTQIRRLLRDVGAGGDTRIDGIAHLWSCRPAVSSGDPDGGDVSRGWRRGAGGLLHLVQAIATEVLARPPRVAVITRDTAEVHPMAPGGWADATLVGLAKVVAREHPELSCRIIDVPGDQTDPAGLIAELLADTGESRVALRAGVRRAERLHRPGPAAPGDAPIRGDGTYLIAGGLGGVGLALAEHLVLRGAGRLLLSGRTTPSADVGARMDRWTAEGTTVQFVAADLGDEGSVAALVAAADSPAMPLRGVFNLAAALDDGILLNTTLAQLAAVLRPKVEGSWNLHRATTGLALDHFVLFGSAAGVSGNPGQGGYAAANTFLDGLAAHRHATGLPALVIDWGAWEGIGATDDEATMARLTSRGVRAMTAAEGLAVLDHLMGQAHPRVAVLPMDTDLPEEFTRLPIMADLVEVPMTTGTPSALTRRLHTAGAAERRAVLADHVSTVVSQVLGMPADAPVDPSAGFFDVGMDSMMALEVRNRLAEALGTALPSSLVMDHPTAGALTAHLLSLLPDGDGGDDGEEDVTTPGGIAPWDGNPAHSPPERPGTEEAVDGELSQLLDNIDALSDEETRTRLRAADAARGSTR